MKIFYGNEIKVLRLRYLNKYKEIIKETFENISKEQKADEFENFINDAVNCKVSKEICKYLGNDFNKHFYDEIRKKTNVDLNYQPHIPVQFKNSNPLGKKFVISKKFQNLLLDMENGNDCLQMLKFYLRI